MKKSINSIDKNDNISSSSRRDFIKTASVGGLGVGLLGSTATAATAASTGTVQQKTAPKPPIKITDLRCAIMGNSPVIRITTDQGIEGYGQAETAKPYLKPFVLFYKDYLG